MACRDGMDLSNNVVGSEGTNRVGDMIPKPRRASRSASPLGTVMLVIPGLLHSHFRMKLPKLNPPKQLTSEVAAGD